MVQRANGTSGFFLSIPRTRGRSDHGGWNKMAAESPPVRHRGPCTQRVEIRLGQVPRSTKTGMESLLGNDRRSDGGKRVVFAMRQQDRSIDPFAADLDGKG